MNNEEIKNIFAFPVSAPSIEKGVTLRDYFAQSAMQGVMIGVEYKHVGNAREVAEWSYAIADAMLKQRNK